jgi:copper transport protein
MTSVFRAFAAALAFLVVGTAGALAHAGLVRTDPPDGAVLVRAPDAVRLSFNEPVGALVLRLLSDNRDDIVLQSRAEGADLVVLLPRDLARGTHVLSWRVASTDGHPVAGSVVFSVGAPSAVDPQLAVPARDFALVFGLWLSRLGVHIGLFVGVGGAFFRAFIARPGPTVSRLTITALAIGGVSTAAALAFQGVDALGLGLGSLATAHPWHQAFQTAYARTAIIALVAIILALASFAVRWPIGRMATGFALLGAGAALAASGHAASADPRWLTRAALLLHGAGLAFWVGALIPLTVLFLSGSERAPVALDRFSRWIPASVIAVVGGGLVLALAQVRHPADLVTTDYGIVLAAKLTMVAALLALAALNRWRYTKPALAGLKAGTRSLSSVLIVEIMLVAGILAVVGLWRFTPPPRVLEAIAEEPASIHIHTDKAMADVLFEPGRAGPVRLTIGLMNGDFGPLAAREVEVTLTNPDRGVEPIRRKADPVLGGGFAVEGITLPVGGCWEIRLGILVSDFDVITLQGAADLRP